MLNSHARSAVVLIILPLLLLSPALCLAAQQKVKLKSAVGTVQVRAVGKHMWRPARIGMILKSGWDVRTFMESSAELEYDNGTILRMGENSVVTLSSLDINEKDQSTMTRVRLPAGQVWGNIKKFTSTKSHFDFETPTAVASIRGTRLGINVRRGRTAVDVYEGEVEVRNRESGRSERVARENRAVVTQGAEGVEVVGFENLRQRP
ncbi:MAG: FecR domain-containing protein, partial [Chitinispirillaceae bacterium]|nr:FecR domain-containing protein [Chitinispirillaceae bacterium]